MNNYVVDGGDGVGVVVHNSGKEALRGLQKKRADLLVNKPRIPEIETHFQSTVEGDYVTMWHYTFKNTAQKIVSDEYFLPTLSEGIFRGQEGVYITNLAPESMNTIFVNLHGQLSSANSAGQLVAIKLRIPKSLIGKTWKDTSLNTFYIKGSKNKGFNFEGLDIRPEIVSFPRVQVNIINDATYALMTGGQPFIKGYLTVYVAHKIIMGYLDKIQKDAVLGDTVANQYVIVDPETRPDN